MIHFFRNLFTFFEGTDRASMVRLMSIILLVIAIVFTFQIIGMTETVKPEILQLLIKHNVVLYGFAFFPKVIQKLFERRKQ